MHNPFLVDVTFKNLPITQFPFQGVCGDFNRFSFLMFLKACFTNQIFILIKKKKLKNDF